MGTLSSMRAKIGRLLHASAGRAKALWDETGQGLPEYALILALVSVATIVILGLLGGQVGSVFSSVSSALR